MKYFQHPGNMYRTIGTHLIDSGVLRTVCNICVGDHTTGNCEYMKGAVRIEDTVVVPRALASVPAMLKACKAPDEIGDSYEILAQAYIRQGTYFGPLEAPVVDSDTENNFLYKVIKNNGADDNYLDLSDPSQCNWMSLVRFSETNFNSVAFQLEGRIYFIVLNELEAGTELTVAYAPGYKNFLPAAPKKMEDALPLSKCIVPLLVSRISKPAKRKTNQSEDTFKADFPICEKLRRLGPCRALEEWKCKFCTAEYFQIPDFASHLITHYKTVGVAKTEKQRKGSSSSLTDDSDPKPPYSCDICEDDKVFNRGEYVIRHLTKHAMGYRCKWCRMIISSSPHICSGSKQRFRCSICSRRVGSAYSLRRHMKIMHDYNKSEPIQGFSVTQPQDVSISKSSKTKLENAEMCFVHPVAEEVIKEEVESQATTGRQPNTNPDDAVISQCPLCQKKCNTEDVEKHRVICEQVNYFISGINPTLECQLCNDFHPCDDLEQFRTHLGQHSHPLMCPGCQFRLRSRDELKIHRCNEFPCDGCVEVFESFLDLRQHIKRIHGKPNFYCYECVFPFVTQEGYLNHTTCLNAPPLNNLGDRKPKAKRESNSNWKRRGQDGNFICEICGAHYSKLSSLKSHRNTHGPRLHECPTCSKQFHRHTLLAEHLFVHLPAQFECLECGKKLKTPKALEVHSRIHTGTKKFICDIESCGKSFCQKVNLMAHRLTHVPLHEKDFQCPYCSKRLASRESCNLHVKAHEEKPFSCTVCSKGFVNAALLKRHMGVAHGTHRYSCAFCSLSVKQKSTILRHLRQKHGEFSDVWLEVGHIESRWMPLDPPDKIGRSRRATIFVEVATNSHTDIEKEEVPPMAEVGTNDAYQNAEEIILSSAEAESEATAGSELVLLQLNQDGEFVLSLGDEEVELVGGAEYITSGFHAVLEKT